MNAGAPETVDPALATGPAHPAGLVLDPPLDLDTDDPEILDLIDRFAQGTRLAVAQARRARAELELTRPRARKYLRFIDSGSSVYRRELAKQFGMTQREFDGVLRRKAVVWKREWLPRKGYETWFEQVREELPNGRFVRVLKVTPEGVDGIMDLFDALGYVVVTEAA
ncbi:phage antirepressor YoqD-like protein [Allonocardiopsis opalescens]|uniref:Phage antirepressor YoqD-like protein n=1 Tax=Allonocardiopsis opalescens TaxID=1144618 RepID=A0A2T0PUA5_9ACTN|nr:phage antirepressor YoqD-like protein [Allonocardiopsis opalescens]